MSNAGRNDAATSTVLPVEVERSLMGLHAAYQGAVKARNDSARREAGARLADYAGRGRDRGWLLADLAEPMRITPEALRQLLVRFGDEEAAWSDGELPDFPQSTVKRRRRRPRPPVLRPGQIESATARRLRQLAPQAAKTKGSTPLDAPERRASEEFSDLIKSLHAAGHSWQQIADASGLSMAGVRMRAARHGYKAGPPKGVAAYQGVYRQSPMAGVRTSVAGSPGDRGTGSGEETGTVLTIELSPSESSLLRSYLARHPGVTSQEAFGEALTLLRRRDLESQYEQADDEWSLSGDGKAWENAVGDGLENEAWDVKGIDDLDDDA